MQDDLKFYKRLKCKHCDGYKVIKNGLYASGSQRFKCANKGCGKLVKRELSPYCHGYKKPSPSCPQSKCGSSKTIRHGRFYNQKQRYKCTKCNKTFS